MDRFKIIPNNKFPDTHPDDRDSTLCEMEEGQLVRELGSIPTDLTDDKDEWEWLTIEMNRMWEENEDGEKRFHEWHEKSTKKIKELKDLLKEAEKGWDTILQALKRRIRQLIDEKKALEEKNEISQGEIRRLTKALSARKS